MSCRQNITPSNELVKQKTKLADMERELAVAREHVRKEEEEEEHVHEAAEARWRAATVLQQQARENRPHVELLQHSVSPVVSHSSLGVIVSVRVVILLQRESWSKS